jgi:hypothetical protein
MVVGRKASRDADDVATLWVSARAVAYISARRAALRQPLHRRTHENRVTARIDTHWVKLLQLVTGGDDGIGLVKAEIHVVTSHEADRTECERMSSGMTPLP